MADLYAIMKEHEQAAIYTYLHAGGAPQIVSMHLSNGAVAHGDLNLAQGYEMSMIAIFSSCGFQSREQMSQLLDDPKPTPIALLLLTEAVCIPDASTEAQTHVLSLLAVDLESGSETPSTLFVTYDEVGPVGNMDLVNRREEFIEEMDMSCSPALLAFIEGMRLYERLDARLNR